ncbi:predicted protein [Plenodomus lingam JN3]|uniref:Predicted protein n=1 Tax=Leptosphaeria maculans (strain JN3 / isolate v23.1.3 / race Av1-4-5-6-7-8) TaxID=985895 RepID=E5AE67_LEPMJ|nr:predicted protein [Plenodomus lingam JN3]CBY01506.1 predicted protein [Plenodomus lingam JN3]
MNEPTTLIEFLESNAPADSSRDAVAEYLHRFERLANEFHQILDDYEKELLEPAICEAWVNDKQQARLQIHLGACQILLEYQVPGTLVDVCKTMWDECKEGLEKHKKNIETLIWVDQEALREGGA